MALAWLPVHLVCELHNSQGVRVSVVQRYHRTRVLPSVETAPFKVTEINPTECHGISLCFLQFISEISRTSVVLKGRNNIFIWLESTYKKIFQLSFT